MQTLLPPALRRYFWDTRPEMLDINKDARYIAERIMTWGDEKACRWLQHILGRDIIRDTLRRSRNLDKKTATFFSYIYDVPQKEVRCLRKPSLQQHSVFWPH